MQALATRLAFLWVFCLVFHLVPSFAFARSAESELCLGATQQTERSLHIPDGFLSAISRVESGKPEGDGTTAPWPWTVNAAGVGHYYASKAEAMAAVELFHQQGILSIDVGCLQVNLQQHPDAFPNLAMAFDPMRNAQYAGNFLLQLFEKTGSWPHAAAAYHSQTPGVGGPYQWKVLEAWATPQDGRSTGSFGGSPFGPNGSQHMVIPQPRHPPVLVASAPNADGSPHDGPVHVFHPFEGGHHFTDAAPSPGMGSNMHGRRMSGTMHGRSLASYRAMSVAKALSRQGVASTID